MNSSWPDRFSPFRVVLAHSRSKNGVASLARSRRQNGDGDDTESVDALNQLDPITL